MDQIVELVAPRLPGRGQTKFTPERIQQISNLVERGKSREEIAELVGVTIGTLQVTCSRLGISLRKPRFDTGTGLLRRGRPRSRNGASMSKPTNGVGAPHPQPNSESEPMDHAQDATPHQRREKTLDEGSASFAIRMQYKGNERLTELPLTQDMIRQLAFEAELRGMSICELIGKVVVAITNRDLFELVLSKDGKE